MAKARLAPVGGAEQKGVRVSSQVAGPVPYALSFTTGGLLAREARTLAEMYLPCPDWVVVRGEAQSRNVLQARTRSTNVRTVREVVQRLATLTPLELGVVVNATSSERSHVMWVAACRRYLLLADFAEEVLRDRFLTLSPTVGHEDFDRFWQSKAVWHTELTRTTEGTRTKLRSNLFRMLVEADLLTRDNRLVPLVLSERVSAALRERQPSDVRFFPTRDVTPEGES